MYYLLTHSASWFLVNWLGSTWQEWWIIEQFMKMKCTPLNPLYRHLYCHYRSPGSTNGSIYKNVFLSPQNFWPEHTFPIIIHLAILLLSFKILKCHMLSCWLDCCNFLRNKFMKVCLFIRLFWLGFVQPNQRFRHVHCHCIIVSIVTCQHE